MMFEVPEVDRTTRTAMARLQHTIACEWLATRTEDYNPPEAEIVISPGRRLRYELQTDSHGDKSYCLRTNAAWVQDYRTNFRVETMADLMLRYKEDGAYVAPRSPDDE